VLLGSNELIHQAHRWRKMFGGGMRQAGVIAAAGLYALDHNRDRLVEDHHRAYQLANGLIDIDGIEIDLKSVQTNMIYLQTKAPAVEIVKKLADHGIDAVEIVKKLAGHGIDVLAIGSNLIRMVTHLHINDEDIEETINVFNKISDFLN